jgi:hypothetical protein
MALGKIHGFPTIYMKHHKGTPNKEHRTPNEEDKINYKLSLAFIIRCSLFDVNISALFVELSL